MTIPLTLEDLRVQGSDHNHFIKESEVHESSAILYLVLLSNPSTQTPSVDSDHPTSSRWTRVMIHGMAADCNALGNACISLVKYYEFKLSVDSILYTGIIWKSVFVHADSSVAACLHLLADPTSGLGSTCLSHIVSSHGESFWQLWQSAHQFLLSATGTQCHTEKLSMVSVTNKLHLCCGIIWHLRLISVWNAAHLPESWSQRDKNIDYGDKTRTIDKPTHV